MSESSARLNLPYIQPSQAQKHVTHNEAIRQLDNLIQMSALSDVIQTPPEINTEADCYIIPANATDGWSDRETQLAIFETHDWLYLTPKAGWLVYVASSQTLKVFNGTSWELAQKDEPIEFTNGPDLSEQKKFAISTTQALWTTDQSDSHIQIYNKNTQAADLGFVFQTAYTTSALFGQFGNNSIRLATTTNGTSFKDALIVDPVNARVSFPNLPRFSAITNYESTFGKSWNTIPFNVAKINDQNCFDATEHSFIVPTDGTYHLHAHVTVKPQVSQHGELLIRLLVDADELEGSKRTTRLWKSSPVEISISSIFNLQSGQSITVQIWSSKNNVKTLPDFCQFWGHKVG